MLQYKIVETSVVTDEELERIVNEWVESGWVFEGFQFAMRESSSARPWRSSSSPGSSKKKDRTEPPLSPGPPLLAPPASARRQPYISRDPSVLTAHPVRSRVALRRSEVMIWRSEAMIWRAEAMIWRAEAMI